MKSATLAGVVLVLFMAAAAKVETAGDTEPHPNCLVEYLRGFVVTNCSSRSLLDVPPGLPRNTQVIILSNNYLTNLNYQFWTSDCKVTGGLYGCSNFPNLSYLEVSYNLLANLSSSCLFGMKELRMLYLDNNKLTTIPYDMLLDNRLLMEIDVSRNRINFLHPKVFQNLTSVVYLNLEGNVIPGFHCDTFKGLNSLIVLYIHNNNITKLDSQLFAELENLQELRIDGNHLRYLPKELLWNLKFLEKFNASNNRLKYLSSTFFVNTQELGVVDLSHNCIQKLSRYVFQELTKILFVNVSFNCLESIYLSHIPVSVHDAKDFTVLVPETDLCRGLVGEIPCFLLGFQDNGLSEENLFHGIDYSFNNISEIRFSQTDRTHSLEFALISLAGNWDLFLPVSFVEQERYIISLNLDGTNLNWRNLTLFNEIFLLPLLKSFSIVGCEACEYYTWELLSSVFNPDIRINAMCLQKHTDDTHMARTVTDACNRSSEDDVQDMIAGNSTVTNHQSENHIKNLELSHDHCEYIDKKTFLFQEFLGGRFHITCMNTMDCSYLSLSNMPKMRPNTSCSILSHNHIKNIEHSFDFSWDLKVLDLSFNSLYHLPNKVFDALRNLTMLRINNNYITSLNSSTFRMLTYLEVLILNDNKISSYSPDVFATLVRLLILSIDFMNLTEFHDKTFENQVRLEKLTVREMNGISSSTKILGGVHFRSLGFLVSLTAIGFKFDSSFSNMFSQPNVIQGLQLLNSSIPNLSSEMFKNTPGIDMLELQRNHIQHLDRHVFAILKNLTSLDLSENEIKFLYEELFSKTRQLRMLNLAHNQLVYIPLTVFDSLTALQVLYLNNNMLILLDYNVFSNLFSLSALYLENSLVTSNYSYFVSLYSCMDLQVNSSNSTIFLQKQKDCILPQILSSYASVSPGALTLIKDNAFVNNSQLNVLNLAHMCIEKIDDETFKSTYNLLYLYLNHNCLTSINRFVFQNLMFLHVLFLHHNQLYFVENGAFEDLKSLTTLYLSFNRLISFDSTALPSVNVLKYLFLNDNFIAEFNLTLNLQSLELLYLDSNPLRVPAVTLFHHLPSLLILELRNTSLCELHADSLQSLDKLTVINLGGNSVEGLSPQHFSYTPNLLMLNMSNTATRSNTADANAGLGWKNLTLINYWFSKTSLRYLIFTGQPICEEIQWVQVILNIFLSETWKLVICSDIVKIPKYSVTTQGNVVIFTLP